MLISSNPTQAASQAHSYKQGSYEVSSESPSLESLDAGIQNLILSFLSIGDQLNATLSSKELCKRRLDEDTGDTGDAWKSKILINMTPNTLEDLSKALTHLSMKPGRGITLDLSRIAFISRLGSILAQNPVAVHQVKTAIMGAQCSIGSSFDSFKHFAALETLHLFSFHCMNDNPFPNLEVLANYKHLSSLKSLYLQDCVIQADKVSALVSGKYMKSLTSLGLHNCSIDKDGVLALAGSESASTLTNLDLSKNIFGSRNGQPGGFHPSLLFASPDQLNMFPDSPLRALAGSKNLSNLVSLNLSKNWIQSGLDDFFYSENMSKLTTLDVSENTMFPAQIDALADSKYMKNLTSLNLSNCKIFSISVRTLVQSESLSNLTDLNLRENGFGNDGAKAIAQFSRLSGLTKLILSWNNIDASGVAALAQSDHLRGLLSLDLSANRIDASGVAELAGSQHLGNLTSLDMGMNKFGEEGARQLANSQYLTHLKSLNLFECNIGEGGAQALAESQNLIGLTSLGLKWNHIKDGGAIALAESQILNGLTGLDVSHNEICDAGATALAKSKRMSRMKGLNLHKNGMSNEVKELLQKNLPGVRVHIDQFQNKGNFFF